MRYCSRACIAMLVTLLCAAVASAAPTRARRPGTVLCKWKSAEAAQAPETTRVVAKHQLREDKRLVGNTVTRLQSGSRYAGNEEKIAAELMATGAVEFAEPDYLVRPAESPNDPSFSSQWFHTRIQSSTAWDVSHGSSSVLVAVCDTGVESTHPDLAANLQLPGFNTVDNTTDSEPIHNHGTRVAGCIGAVGNNGVGVAGVCWNIRILPIRITNRPDGMAYYSDMAEAIRYAADAGARVVNLSYGGAGSSTIDSAAKYLRSKGGLLVMAAANDGEEQAWPDFTSFLAVGSVNSGDARSSFSNWGEYIDLVAPGEYIYTTNLGGSYVNVSGTSFSSPITAGAAALLWSANPNLTVNQVEERLLSTCDDLGATGDDNVFGRGRLNAGAALAGLQSPPPPTNEAPVANASATPATGYAPLEVLFTSTGSADADGEIAGWLWDFGDGQTSTQPHTVHTYSTAGTYTARLTVTDDDGATDSDTVPVVVTTPPVHNVAVQSVSGPASMAQGDSATLTVTVQNLGNVAETFSVSVTVSPGDAALGAQTVSSLAAGAQRTLSFVWDTSEAAAGAHTITAIIPSVSGETNVSDNAATRSITVNVPEPDPVPDLAASFTATPATGTAPLEVAFDGSASNGPAVIIKYEWDFGDGATGSGEICNHMYSEAGSFTARLTVTDELGSTAVAEKTIQAQAAQADPAKALRVEKIRVKSRTKKGQVLVKADIKVVDGRRKKVRDTTVRAAWSGAVEAEQVQITNGGGKAQFQTEPVEGGGTFTFRITGLEKEGYTFDPAGSAEAVTLEIVSEK